MKNILNIGLLFVAVLFMVACEDDGSQEFTRLFVSGPTGGDPEDTGEYSLGDVSGTVSWSIDNADIASVASATGTDATINFLKAGDFRLTGSNGTLEGWIDVTVAATSVGVSVTYDEDGALNSTGTGTITFTFDAPLASTPTFQMNTDSSQFVAKTLAFQSGTLGTLTKVTDSKYTAGYTAGTGDGTPEGWFTKVTINDTYGGDTMDSLYVQLFEVDNTAGIGEVELSEALVTDSTEVSITVTFNEAVRPAMTTAADTLVRVDISGAGVATVKDTLWATEDPKVWMLNYLTNGNGDGSLTVAVDQATVTDLAGNLLITAVAGSLTIDNTAPVATGAASDITGQVVQITTDGYWLFLEDGADAPTAMGDFSAGGQGDDTFLSSAGTYDVYFIAEDAAGNVSAITSQLGFVVN